MERPLEFLFLERMPLANTLRPVLSSPARYFVSSSLRRLSCACETATLCKTWTPDLRVLETGVYP